MAVEMEGIRKIYPDGTVALRGVDLKVEEGEIHALLGENGAGKTSLMRILYGEIRPTSGIIRVFGEKVSFRSPRDALKKGIAMVYQSFSLVPSMTALENLQIAMTSIRKMERKQFKPYLESLIEETGFEIPLDVQVEDLPVSLQQRCEILKALLLGARILILDEPTSVLTPTESKALFSSLRKLNERGITIIFISHKLKEVKEIADRITVLRKGVVVGRVSADEVSEADLARMMVAREVVLSIEKPPSKAGEDVLKVENLRVRDSRGLEMVKGVSFSLKRGEILGVAGVQGNGQKELVEAIVGIRPCAGRILLNGVDITGLPTRERYGLGLSYVPGSRSIGLVLDMNVHENSILTLLRRFSRRRILDSRGIKKFSENIVKNFDITLRSFMSPVRFLSGGNQQRLMMGREISKNPSVLVVEEPTHGLDVASTEYVRRILLRLREEGVAMLLVSSDLDEVLGLSDRILVMYNGRIVGSGRPEEFTMEKLGLMMGGAAEVPA